MDASLSDRVHRISHPGHGSVNSWVIEGGRDLVVVDCQRTPAAADAIVELANRLGKPVVAVLITHAHPDHTLGLQRLIDAFGAQLPVYSSRRTRELLQHDVYGYVALTRGAVDDRLPDPLPLPNETVSHLEQIRVGDCVVRVVELGPGEAEAMTAYEFPELDVVAVGDLVEHRMVPFLLEQRSAEWLRQLAKAKQILNATSLLPGHGDPGERDVLIDWQMRYLRDLRSAVRQCVMQAPDSTPESVAKSVAADIENQRGPLDTVALIPQLGTLNAAAVYAELFHDE